MSQMVRNDSASIIPSLQMYDSDEEENSGSRNNSIDTKDAIKDMDIDNDDDENQKTTETEVKKEESDNDNATSQEEKIDIDLDQVKTENSVETETRSRSEEDMKVKSDFELIGTELKPDPLPFTQRVQINAAPVVDVAIKEEVASRSTPLDEIISDDEDGHNHRQIDEDKTLALSEPISKESPTSQTSQKKPTQLVSYGPDEDFDEDESDSDSEEDINPEESHENSPALSDPSALSRSVQNMSGDDIKIPPEPPGNCSRLLQNRIENMYDRMRREGLDLNKTIQNKKSFRNPSIYEKLIDFCNIDQKGTNFPPEIYDPHLWGKESFYDELDKAQRKDMERREKDKRDKTKIEFVVGTKKSSSDGSSYPDEKKRKTKWDTQPSGVVKAPSVQGPGVVNLTATATGTKATVIPAVGSLSKKSSK